MDFPPLDVSLAYRVHRLQRLLRRQFLAEGTAAGFALTPEQFFVLDKLVRRDAVPQRALADEALQDRANLTRMLRDLEGRGLVTRAPDPHDARRRLVRLTDEGRTTHARFVDDVVRPVRAQLFAPLTDDDVAAVHRVFDALEAQLVE